jgi:hypothetical protein
LFNVSRRPYENPFDAKSVRAFILMETFRVIPKGRRESSQEPRDIEIAAE